MKLIFNYLPQAYNRGDDMEAREAIAESAYTTMKGPIEANPVPVTREDILNLYSKSM